jgi:hypothetical protein
MDNYLLEKNLKWVKSLTSRYALSARIRWDKIYSWDTDDSYAPGPSEGEYFADIVEWCQTNNCGTRTSYDTFKFKNEKEMTMFLLRWS